jgi:ribosomal protein S18 acetylase RimI-like enzyme
MTTVITDDLTVHTMTRKDLDRALAWAANEGWNPGTHDASAFFAADPAGLFVADLSGEPVACLAAVRFGENFGFLGLYIVRPEYRGRGIGQAVWAAGMAHLAGRNLGLNGVLEQVPKYEQSGFRVAHYITRYSGRGGGTRPAGLVPLHSMPFEHIASYDAACFPARRDALLRKWITLPQSIALGAAGSRGLTGYGVLRKSAYGYKVGPLFADDAETAARLLAGLVATIPGETFTIDVPDATGQPSALPLVGLFELIEEFRTARMYTPGEPRLRMSRVFGVTSLELG